MHIHGQLPENVFGGARFRHRHCTVLSISVVEAAQFSEFQKPLQASIHRTYIYIYLRFLRPSDSDFFGVGFFSHLALGSAWFLKLEP